MQRHRQTLHELLERLSVVDTSWRDPFADAVIRGFESFPNKANYVRADLAHLLETVPGPDSEFTESDRFQIGLTVIRLFLDLSKDDFTAALSAKLGNGGSGLLRYKKDKDAFCAALETMGILEAITTAVHRPTAWHDVFLERLKSGRGSAIKGQARGRALEDRIQTVVRAVFGAEYELRCRFQGKSGLSTEKCDFAIPSKSDPRILIEAKAYGATGSKQTDILGDVSRIVEQKRHDTHFLFVTDGTTWRARTSDLSKLVHIQNQGEISRIYTLTMLPDLQADLQQLKLEHGL